VTRVRTESDTHVGISHLEAGGRLWTRSEVVEALRSGAHQFPLAGPGRGELAIVEGAIGSYVRARADGRWTDALLQLPRM
jgi:hypothetical protein